MELEEELKKRKDFFDEELEKFLRDGNPEELYDAARHLPIAGGKRLRPILSMVSCEAVSGEISMVVPLALAVEIVHTFTLVHDDIMDKSKLRRSQPSVHMKYGEPTAIMAGDLLFTKGFESMHRMTVSPSVFKNVEYGLIDTVKEICEGQQLDMSFQDRHDVSEGEYLKMILKKTAVFFQYACEAGGIVGGADSEKSNALSEYGKNLGLAFQIHDDYLDMSSDSDTIGKDIGNDIRNGKKTLIAVHALNNASRSDKKILENIFGNKDASEEEIKQVYDAFKRTGSIDYAKKKAIWYSKKAIESLGILERSEAQELLKKIADFSIKRVK
ncbi:MAG: polyprenyl synthetase family protein [Candidatus Thermoplasmatota archaeon]